MYLSNFLWSRTVKAYDVGDRIGIDGETLTISKINLLSTYAYTAGNIPRTTFYLSRTNCIDRWAENNYSYTPTV